MPSPTHSDWHEICFSRTRDAVGLSILDKVKLCFFKILTDPPKRPDHLNCNFRTIFDDL